MLLLQNSYKKKRLPINGKPFFSSPEGIIIEPFLFRFEGYTNIFESNLEIFQRYFKLFVIFIITIVARYLDSTATKLIKTNEAVMLT